MRNYFNAKVAYHDKPDEPIEIIIKVGDEDPDDDMFVDEYVSHQSELETIKRDGHPDYTLLDYWKNPGPNVDALQEPLLEPARTMVAQDFEDWMSDSGDYADDEPNDSLSNG